MTDGRLPIAQPTPERQRATTMPSADGDHGPIAAGGATTATAGVQGSAARREPVGVARSVAVIGSWALLVVLVVFRHGGGVTLQA
jgi:hypothetical protein